MHLISPRTEWPGDEKPDWVDGPDYIPVIMGCVFYVFGLLIACFVLANIAYPLNELREKPWIPALARNDGCLTLLFFVLPAFFWPLAPVVGLLHFIYFVLKAMAYGIWSFVGPATSCCGIPLPRWWSESDHDVATAVSSAPDLEMGHITACAEDGVGGEPGGAVDDPGPAGLRSGESVRPPPYTCLPPDDDEDSGETDGLLAKNTKEVDMGGK